MRRTWLWSFCSVAGRPHTHRRRELAEAGARWAMATWLSVKAAVLCLTSRLALAIHLAACCTGDQTVVAEHPRRVDRGVQARVAKAMAVAERWGPAETCPLQRPLLETSCLLVEAIGRGALAVIEASILAYLGEAARSSAYCRNSVERLPNAHHPGRGHEPQRQFSICGQGTVRDTIPKFRSPSWAALLVGVQTRPTVLLDRHIRSGRVRSVAALRL